jgi:hypothetical protein
MVDNRYFSDGLLLFHPLKMPQIDHRFVGPRQWLESLCKDVDECMFGILKGCWRILKTAIQL